MVLIKLNTIGKWYDVVRLMIKLTFLGLKPRKKNYVLIYSNISIAKANI